MSSANHVQSVTETENVFVCKSVKWHENVSELPAGLREYSTKCNLIFIWVAFYWNTVCISSTVLHSDNVFTLVLFYPNRLISPQTVRVLMIWLPNILKSQ